MLSLAHRWRTAHSRRLTEGKKHDADALLSQRRSNGHTAPGVRRRRDAAGADALSAGPPDGRPALTANPSAPVSRCPERGRLTMGDRTQRLKGKANEAAGKARSRAKKATR